MNMISELHVHCGHFQSTRCAVCRDGRFKAALHGFRCRRSYRPYFVDYSRLPDISELPPHKYFSEDNQTSKEMPNFIDTPGNSTTTSTDYATATKLAIQMFYFLGLHREL